MSDLKTHALKLCELAEELQTYIEKAALTGPRSGHTLAAEIMIVKALCSEHGATLTTHGVYVNREALVCAMQLFDDDAQPHPDIREAFLSLKQSLK